MAFCPGYLRGLAFVGDYAVVGLSAPAPRQDLRRPGAGRGLEASGAEARCGLHVIDLRTGDVAHWVRFEGLVRELYDVAVLPGVVRPALFGFKTEDVPRTISVGDPEAHRAWIGRRGDERLSGRSSNQPGATQKQQQPEPLVRLRVARSCGGHFGRHRQSRTGHRERHAPFRGSSGAASETPASGASGCPAPAGTDSGSVGSVASVGAASCGGSAASGSISGSGIGGSISSTPSRSRICLRRVSSASSIPVMKSFSFVEPGLSGSGAAPLHSRPRRAARQPRRGGDVRDEFRSGTGGLDLRTG